MQIFVVVNPAAGGGRAGRLWPKIAARLAERVGAFDHAETTAPGEATALARLAVEAGAELVVAVGGDGTANEVANGLLRPGEAGASAAFALVPAGTGSDLARSLGRRDPAAAIEAIAAGSTRRIDLGRASFIDDAGRPVVRHFVNNGGFGLSGAVGREVAGMQGARLLPRKVIFLAATVRALLHYRFPRVRLAIDGETPAEREIALVAAANGRFFGAGMKVAPDAALGDGLFDIVTLAATSKSVLLRDLHQVYSGRHREHPAITIRRGRRLSAEPLDAAGGPVLVDLDGESPGRIPAVFEMLPGALTVRA